MPFETKYLCDTCVPPYTFWKVTDVDPRKVKCKTPSCPQCRSRKAQAKSQMKVSGALSDNMDLVEVAAEREKNMTDIIQSHKAPTFHAPSNFSKAIDKTAEIVMQDQNMTDIDLGSNLRAGDTCVPKLTHDQEKQVAEVFNSKQKNNVMGMQGDNLTKGLMKQISAGAFRNYGDPVARQQADPALAPKINVMHHYTGKPN